MVQHQAPVWQRVVRRIYLTFSVSLLAFIALFALSFVLGLRVISTDSLPRGLYWKFPSGLASYVPALAIQRGRVVAACLPASIAAFGMRHQYLPKGKCPDGSGELAKVVAAIGGDVVTEDAKGVTINGNPWPWSAPMDKDFDGQHIPTKLGTYIVPTDSILLLGLNYGSWDGRYFGPISRSDFRGVVWPLVTEAGDAAKVLRQQ